MTRATEYFSALGLDAETVQRMGDRDERTAWESHDDPRFLLRAAVELGADRQHVADLLAVPSRSHEQLRELARRLLKDAARPHHTGSERRAIYAQRCAILAVVTEDERSAGYWAHSAIAYSPTPPSADAVRARVPWSEARRLAEDEGGLDRARLRRVEPEDYAERELEVTRR